MSEIDEVIARVPQWQGCSIVVAPLNGGLTNTNFKVEVDGMPYVVRVPGHQTELLSIDRRNEYNNTLIAARAGLGARPLYYAPEQCAMVLEYIPGPTMSAAWMRAPEMIPRIASSIRLLHSGPTFRNRFNMFRVMEYYLQVVGSAPSRSPTAIARTRW
jgi:thiamine kinase-like enzyme